MNSILQHIESPADLKNLTGEEIQQLCEELRQEIIAVTHSNGGHLASNLGAVELTVAAHLAFDLPEDKIIWDVGHQSYTHKLLTGRRDRFSTLRRKDGISGFPKREESPYDAFNTGHSSTALSAAVGMVRGMRLQGNLHHVLAVVGDGSFGGGMNWEALNDAGHSRTPVILLLNDNEMSINRNVGALSAYLTRLRSDVGYVRVKRWMIRKLTRSSRLFKGLDRIKDLLKFLLTDGILFEEMGWTYLGPVDGHNVEELRILMERAKSMDRPVLIHAITQKGIGMVQAERDPSKYHAVGPWYVETPSDEKPGISMAGIAGKAVLERAKIQDRICCLTAAMTDGVGLSAFAKEYPQRFFDTGITEQHAVTMAAGLAASGMKPTVFLYATFLQRAYDSLLHDVALQNLPVVFMLSHCGSVGEDGETHQGIFSSSMLLPLPNLRVYAPYTPTQLPEILDRAYGKPGPAAVCYPKEMDDLDSLHAIHAGEIWPVLHSHEESDTVFVCVGRMNAVALRAVQQMKKPADVVACDTLAPLPAKGLKKLVSYRRVIVVEDAERDSSVGVHIRSALDRMGYIGRVDCLGHEERILHQASFRQQLAASHLDAAGLAAFGEEEE